MLRRRMKNLALFLEMPKGDMEIGADGNDWKPPFPSIANDELWVVSHSCKSQF